jgi:putative ABC transport system ATP-binding protein
MPLIHVDNLRKNYAEEGEVETFALRGVSLDIEPGEFVAIMGPSGSGKSTLLHILGFLDRPTSGIYTFHDKSIQEYTDEDLAHIRNEKMGFVFQTFNLLPRTTVYENVKLPLRYSDKDEKTSHELTLRAIEEVGLSHRIHHHSSELSGGERQRVAIARALVNNPSVIFADEPTGNLDSKSGGLVLEAIRELNEKRGHTVVLVTHESYASQHAKRIITLRDGMIESDEVVGNHRRIGSK